QGAQDRVVGDVFGVAAGLHVRAVEHRRDAVVGAVVVLVERHQQQAVVRLGPGGVRVEVVLQPGVPGGDAAVVHVVAHVRYHDGQRGQVAEGGGEHAEAQVAR